ncbi:MAG: hypothetical protein AAF902_08070 [Chloroflexota bacterium]
MSDEINKLEGSMGDDIITDDDKLWAALSMALGIVGLIMLFIPEKSERPFIKYAAVHGVAIAAIQILFVIIPFVQCITGILSIILAVYAIYLAIAVTFQGQYAEIPYLTDFLKGQGWI